jgi:hypothetical protein
MRNKRFSLLYSNDRDIETIVGVIYLARPIFDKQQGGVRKHQRRLLKPRYSAELGKKIAEHLKDDCRRLSDHWKP